MAKEKKSYKVKGYTIRDLKWTGIFGNGIISIEKSLTDYNEVDVQFCSELRYENCGIAAKCEMCRPRCYYDQLHCVGKKTGENLTESDRKKIERMLKSEYKKCRPISIEIKES